MSGPLNALAFQPSAATANSFEGTSSTSSNTTARAIPDTSADQLMVCNLDASIIQYFAMGASTGPNANTATARIALPPGTVQIFTRRQTDTHAYFSSASGTPAYSMVSGTGY